MDELQEQGDLSKIDGITLEEFNKLSLVHDSIVMSITATITKSRDFLPVKTFFKYTALSTLPILSEIMDTVLDFIDIGATESHYLHLIMIKYVDMCSSLFGSIETANKYLEVLEKYRQVAELLELNLEGIKERFLAGIYSEWEMKELKGMVRALFSDSEKRRAVVDMIESSIQL